jgi:hypothetical protein
MELASLAGRFTFKEAVSTHSAGGRVVTSAVRDALEKKGTSSSFWDLNHDSLVIKPVS